MTQSRFGACAEAFLADRGRRMRRSGFDPPPRGGASGLVRRGRWRIRPGKGGFTPGPRGALERPWRFVRKRPSTSQGERNRRASAVACREAVSLVREHAAGKRIVVLRYRAEAAGVRLLFAKRDREERCWPRRGRGGGGTGGVPTRQWCGAEGDCDGTVTEPFGPSLEDRSLGFLSEETSSRDGPIARWQRGSSGSVRRQVKGSGTEGRSRCYFATRASCLRVGLLTTEGSLL
ncbi:uncharacterized protein LOC119154219 isoform X1 [Falco rusticolus]|uniref:uncharacterized protein LOC119154219 isoform X1 n=1 Tax=Falco rusticolus TaxID=120794 RepID=UPI0018868819|nr:uncharacterized protein LOC119154219 isoform X1 [Falco rusticolus]XP_037257392.1 uncharacterized protein LOC119154219 isoform X1 [Falco rusticolus]